MKTSDEEWNKLLNIFYTYLEGIGRVPETITHHQTALNRFLTFLKIRGSVQAEAVTPKLIAEYQAWFYDAKSHHGRPYSITSQITGLNSLRVFFKYLENTGHITNSPAATLQLPKQPRRLPATILSTKEMKKLLRQPDTKTVLGFRDRTMYEVLYSSGLRINELIRLRVQDLRFDEPSLFVPESKRTRDRIVPLGKTACCFLAEYTHHVRPLLLKNDNDIVFLSRFRRCLNGGGVQKKLQTYARQAGLKKHLTIHVFRHTLATEMLRRGADIRQIQELLGHNNLRTTQLYTHIMKAELKRVQSNCHPREQTRLPNAVFKYRGRDYLTEEDKNSEHRNTT